MGKKIIISFIIPAHNASKTIEKAVKSIICDQEVMDKIEIIIVENTSSDETTKKCEELVNTNHNVYLYHSDKGVSNARNKGIEKAKGCWLFFVDADDYLTIGTTKKLLIDAESNNADMIMYGYESGNEKVRLVTKDQLFSKENLNDIKVKMLKNPTRYMTVWSKLLRKEIIVNQEISFNSELRLAEDGDFIINYNRYCRLIKLSSIIGYHYTANSISTVHEYDGNKARDYITALITSKKAIADENDVIKKAYNFYIMMHLNVIMVHEVFAVENKLNWWKQVGLLRTLAQTETFKKAIQETKISECKTGRMLPILFIKMHLYNLAGFLFRARIWQNKRKELFDK
ncbi:glycosyltransferase [Ligilactobacillus sp. WILCCON 0076]|uniref:Glycosyltransferase n=1 Tax=Ligilactobacillus ubinensis TaxID=2876789 RepID=A0A9X2FLM0_9LACO|nr:glycosyltransferase family 2 protein [Ligilactobacillus ubinensis]MCP0887615.1 glycosyltransferase [Ligilactobacillus ubinensis]